MDIHMISTYCKGYPKEIHTVDFLWIPTRISTGISISIHEDIHGSME